LSTAERDNHLDVAIVGGGMAGALLARQLKRTRPGLSVGLFEKATECSYKVGESLVEIAANYLIRRHQLSEYLYENHLPKNGLRYFFDDESHATDLAEMSEIGPINLPFHPAFQIDRARFDADLLAMAEEAGVEVRTGARVEDLEMGSGGEPHRFAARAGDSAEPYRCRWLIDASGRAGLLAKHFDLRTPEEDHRIASVWARFRGVSDIDQVGNAEWRGRVRHSARRLSTLHFWYEGYWFWMIPLRGGVTSVGLVGEIARDREIRTAQGFREFLGRHGAVEQLLGAAEMIDCASFSQIAYGTERFLHPDRWGVVGEAALATDPFYSPGADFIALGNDFLADLVDRDLGGESSASIAERLDLYERFLQFRREAVMLLYRGLYNGMGSYELMRMKWDLDIGCYYNLWVSPYMLDQHLDERFLRRQLRMRPFVLKALRNFADLFRRVESALRANGQYFRCNRGRFSPGLENIDFVNQVGTPRSRREVLEKTEQVFNMVLGQATELLGESARDDGRHLPLQSFMSEQPLG
jgi:flavin-dependent dehydrogenase